MAITFIGSATASAINGANVNITLPAGTAQNDVVIVLQGCAGVPQSNPGATDGYTLIANTSPSARANKWVGWKVMGASPDATVTLSGTAGASEAVAGLVLVYRGVDTTTPMDVAATESSGNSTNPDCPSITPTSNDCAILALANSEINDATPGTVAGYSTPVVIASAAETRPQGSAGCYLIKTGGAGVAEDPAAYSSWTTGNWNSTTVALRPSASGSQVGAATFSGASNFSASATSAQSAAATFAGTGGLSAAVNLKIAVSATFAGASTFRATTLAQMQALATFAGASTFSALTDPTARSAAATFPGAGAFSALGNLSMLVAATLPGTSGLSASLATFKFGAMTLQGSGALSAFGNLLMVGAATFQGAGSLSAFMIIPGQATVWQATATFAGAGVLSASLRQNMAANALLQGIGGLSATMAAKQTASAQFDGAGTFSARANLGMRVRATLQGAGTFSALLQPTGVVQFASVVWSGAGSLSAEAARNPAPPPFYDYPIGNGLWSDYGLRASRTSWKAKLVIGRRY